MWEARAGLAGRNRIGGIEKTTNRYVKVYYEGRPTPRVQPTLRRRGVAGRRG
jgi:hypothetical protein